LLDALIFLLIGYAASMLGSMSGLGGGFLAIPLLTLVYSDIKMIIGSVKFMVFINSLVSTIKYTRRIKIPMDIYVFVIIPMLISSYIGAYLVAILPVSIISLVLGSVLIALSLLMIVKPPSEVKQQRGLTSIRGRYVLSALSGFTSGLLAGISGLGGGVVNVPVFVYLLRLNPHNAVSLSMACILPSALTSTVRHYIDNIIDWYIAIPLGFGAVIGGFTGASISLRIDKKLLAKIIGLMIMFASARLIIEQLLNT